jgi:hypothetical protein
LITVVCVLLPALIFFYICWRSSVRSAILHVFIPTLVLIPPFMPFYIGGMAIQPLTVMVIFLAWFGFFPHLGRFHFNVVDVAALCMLGTAFYADYHYRELKISLYSVYFQAVIAVFPYLIGRTIFERFQLRAEACKIFVCCLAVVGILCVWEYRMTSNPFTTMVEFVMQRKAQWGEHGHLMRLGPRTEGPYGQAILCATVFSAGIFLQLWLHIAGYWRKANNRNSRWTYVVWASLCIGLLLTQSRGPFIGIGLGLLVASIGLFKKPARAAAIAFPILLVVGTGLYFVIDSYTNVDYNHIAEQGGSLDQQNAAYRRELIATYMPLIEEGGLWGWGSPLPIGQSYGFTSTQVSIDNEYLRTAMAQGYVGVALLLVVTFVTIIKMLLLVFRTKDRQERIFYSIILGICVCYAFTISTVFLGEPIAQIFFLFCGWANTLDATPRASLQAASAGPLRANAQRTRFRQVYQ